DAGVMATELEEAVRHLADEPIEPYAVHTAVPLADAEDEDVTRVILAPGEEEDDRTLVAPPPEPAAEGEPMPRHSAAGTPSRKPTPPRRRRETRRGVGGILVWGIVLAVLASAAIWGWSEMSRAPRVVVQPPEADTIPEQ